MFVWKYKYDRLKKKLELCEAANHDLHCMVMDLKERLAVAERNDKRDSKGRYTKDNAEGEK